MKIYRAWSDSHHKIQYTYGYFTDKKTAEACIKQLLGESTACSPPNGVDEINVIEDTFEKFQELNKNGNKP